MNHRRAFEIAFVGLKPGIHEFEYSIEDKFFTEYGEQDFTNCKTSVKLRLDRKQAFLMLKFDIDGRADVNCDRCGNPLQVQLWDEFSIIVKMVEDAATMNEQEDDPDVFYINKTESHLYIGDWIYEFINLSIPLQKSCGEQEIGGPKCNNEVLEKLKRMEDDAKKTGGTLWKGLEKFKDLE